MLDTDTALGGYINQLDTLKTDIISAEEALAKAGDAVGKIKDIQQSIDETKDNSVKLRETAKTLDQIIDLMTKFGPLKALAKPLETIAGEMRSRADQLDEQVGTITEIVVPFQTIVKIMEGAIYTARAAMWDARGDIVSVENSLNEASETLANTEDMLPEEAIATYEAVLGDDGTLADIAADIDGVAATIARVSAGAQDVISGIDVLDGFGDAMIGIADQISAVLDPISSLINPLNAVGDVLEEFEWVLDAADWAFDTFVSPVLDPILETLGIQALIDRLAQPLEDLMPDIDILPNFLGDFDLAGKLEDVFGPIDSEEPGVFSDAKDAAASLSGLVGGEFGIVGELFRDGAGTDDFLMGVNSLIFNESTLNGGDGRDILGAGEGDDALYGGDDDDILIAGEGDDLLDGGNDVDAVVFNGYFGQFRFHAETGDKMTFVDTGSTALGTETTYNIEYFVFRDISWTYEQLERAIRVDYSTTPPTTEISGDQPDPDNPSELIIDDILIGGDMDDTLNGLTGNDYMLGFGGYDTVRGGSGIDTYSYSGEVLEPESTADGVTVILDLSLDASLLAQRTDDIQGVENIVGTNGFDLIIGDSRANELNGGGYSDTLVGGGGNDRLIGADGTDNLIGGRGNDFITGGVGIDLFFAGRGRDTYMADSAESLGYLDFDLLFYGGGFSVLFERETQEIIDNIIAYDRFALDDLPDAIDANLTTGRVRKLTDTGQARFGVDTLVNISNLLATDGEDTIQAGSYFAILDGAGGDDEITGFRPTLQSDLQLLDIEGEVSATRQGSILAGGTGDDLLTSYTGDDVMVGGFGDDRIVIKTDASAIAPDDRFDAVGGIFGGFDTRESGVNLLTLIEDFADASDIADTGWDSLDLTESDHAWVLYMNTDSAEAYENALPRTAQAGDLVNSMMIHGIEEVFLGDIAGEVWAKADAELHVHGGDGDDHLNGSSGTLVGITLEGNGGNDRIMGSSGIDVLDGGDGDDLIADLAGAHDGVETVNGGAGDDVFRAAANSAYNIDGGTGHDLAAFSSQDGALVLDLGRGRSNVNGRQFTITGIESIIGSTSDDRLTGTTGTDLLAGFDGDDILTGRTGDDALFGGWGDDILQGGAGNDRLHGGLGTDRIFGGSGFDTLDLNETAFGEIAVHYETYVADFDVGWQVDLGLGTATIISPDDAVSMADFTLIDIEAVRGSGNDDDLTGNRFGNLLSGEAGDDVIDGADGNDVISGGDGDDTIMGGNGADQISGNTGENTIYGGNGNDVIIGADVDDPVEMIYFNSPRDDLRTGRLEVGTYDAFPAGSFTIDMMVKADPVADTGQGSYTLMSYAVPDSHNEFLIITAGATDQLRIVVNNSFIFDTGYATGGTMFDGTAHRVAISVDTATGSLALYLDGEQIWSVTNADGLTPLTPGGHLVFGQDQDGVNANYDPDQALIGAVGDIRMYDKALTDLEMENTPFTALSDPEGTDGLMAYWQVDQLYGLSTLSDALGGDPLTKVGGSSNGFSSDRGDSIFGEAGADEIHGGAGGDNINGGTHNDLLYGNDGRDSISGDAGNDTMFGGDGGDAMYGGTGHDSVHGGADDDQIFGDDGDDTMVGGGGADFIFGGAGNDIFVFSSAEDTVNESGYSDYIHDFVAGEDIVDLSGMDANTDTIVDNAFTFIGVANFTGRAGELAILPDGSGQFILTGDQDGDAEADFEIYLGSSDIWSASDFVL